MTTAAEKELKKLINDCLPIVSPRRLCGLALLRHLDRAPLREREAIEALLIAIRCHYPSVYQRIFALEPEIERVVSQEVNGRLIKLARIARSMLAEYL